MGEAHSAATPEAVTEAVVVAARAGEPDRYLAALLAPSRARPHLLAIAAFAAELALVPQRVRREPAMGRIRLEWWREAIEATGEQRRTGNPVADALRAAMETCQLPAAVLIEVIDARELELARQGLADEADLAGYLWSSEGALFALAGGILSRGSEADLRPAAVAAGQAYGLARLLMGLPHVLARGWVAIPQSRLDAFHVTSAQLWSCEAQSKAAGLVANLCAEARVALARSRQLVANLPRAVGPAFLPLALVETYLRAAEEPARSNPRSPPRVAPLRRVWRMAVAHWFGRF
jgi:phytoene synthase